MPFVERPPNTFPRLTLGLTQPGIVQKTQFGSVGRFSKYSHSGISGFGAISPHPTKSLSSENIFMIENNLSGTVLLSQSVSCGDHLSNAGQLYRLPGLI